MKILIIGASGYIGSHIFNRLKKNGVDVVGIDYSNNKYNEINSSDIIHISYQNLKREFLNKFTELYKFNIQPNPDIILFISFTFQSIFTTSSYSNSF